MTPPRTLATRRARVVRINAKRPPAVEVRAMYRPRPSTLDELADLVLELLDERARSGRG